jgi:XRE family transcriptional regulator, regulator of sulfur utilization
MAEGLDAPEIGPAVRQTRSSRNLTLDQLARASGVSKSMLSQIERGQANPTFAVLWSITRALGIEIADLTSNEQTFDYKSIIALTRHIGVPQTRSEDGLCKLSILNPPQMAGQLEWYDITLEPGGVLDSPAHARGAFEHLSTIEGSLEVTSGLDTQVLNQGEIARYPADIPHRIANVSSARARGVLVLIYT